MFKSLFKVFARPLNGPFKVVERTGFKMFPNSSSRFNPLVFGLLSPEDGGVDVRTAKVLIRSAQWAQ